MGGDVTKINGKIGICRHVDVAQPYSSHGSTGWKEGIYFQIWNLPFLGIFIMKSESRIDLDEHQTHCTKDL
jgi:hypothetical protein